MDKPDLARNITERPSAARIYDYLLGGYHNFEVDRLAARRFIDILPDAPMIMRTNRAFLRRAVKFLAEQGIDQFLDLGSGIPTVGNVHEIAQEINPSVRVVYVDIDPVAVRHSEEILKDNPKASVIQADVRQIDYILEHPTVLDMLDLGKPAAVLITSVLLFITEDEEANNVVRAVRDALSPDSYLVISHGILEGAVQEQVDQSESLYASIGTPIKIRTRAQVESFFEGFELVEPGLVFLPSWRPEGPDDLSTSEPKSWGQYGGIGRKL